LFGSGQQQPFRAPQREQRIAFEIVSSGVSPEIRKLSDSEQPYSGKRETPKLVTTRT
jgi:hypothetical protein